MEVHTPITSFIVGTLAVWRVTHLLWAEDGPFDLLVRLRKLAGARVFGRLLDCFYCLSLWISIPVAWLLTASWTERVIVWLGLSGGAMVLQKITTRTTPAPPPAVWRETTVADKQR